MKLGDLFDYGVPEGAGAIDITGLTADSRKVKPGFLFAALKGVAAHGRDFVEQAKANGAVAVLSAGDLGFDPGIAEVVTKEPRRDFALAASAFYVRRPRTIVAVTGTNGKSSTVDFLRQIWTHAGKRAASLGTLGAIGPNGVVDLGHTTPDPAAMHESLSTLSDQGVTHVAMEASSHGLEQHRVVGVTFAAGAFTNLTQDHLDYHLDMASYRDAKLKLWELVRVGGPAVINADAADADLFERAAKQNELDVVLCGWRAPREHALKIVEILPRPNAQTMVLLWDGKEHKVELPLIGEFQALNAVCAAALALATGEALEAVLAGMAKLKPVKGRMEHIGQSKSGGHVFVDYAHTPDGLDVLLRAARPHAPGRIIAVFGCGGDRDSDKRPKMGAIAARQADIVIVTDDNPRSEDPAAIRAQILKAAPNATEIGDRAQAIREAVAMLKAGDALMIAGKGHETGQIIKGVTHPFSDQDIARAALES
ncbi:UDP-N-acetylmuramoyl-L-alanyl-D-glutamate--2,6-diaminopimelate ligase [Candidatus Viadribacter manganicus]|uniref:UDP-N-acetylmuramoyl-L-alanyl-D-glutamate--2,6-diaminopimelate ligase n=1 Tax=Candidatus Viadribacter manganicus TaxID=1759059 RepID=A0A1B1AKU1_9PROT|nr:UDP-N-acetylmuramoyl-L-alanyl-D-glutamate--2,6-diaminopimelate ligase [Candidatus Viadribacter manganicus]ANP47198.1 UDP-N-acetylmuramoylalanyl-D-glutamate--2,6-diaminopimelate ligase [Candidatus Viadribacter manganicus]